MLLAEALAARKDTIMEIDSLRDRLAAAALRYEDDHASGEQPGAPGWRAHDGPRPLRTAQRADQRHQQSDELVIRRPQAEHHGGDRAVGASDSRPRRAARPSSCRGGNRVGPGPGRGFLVGRRTKDELPEVPTVDVRAERRASDELSERVRRLDLALQQRNWTTELLESSSLEERSVAPSQSFLVPPRSLGTSGRNGSERVHPGSGDDWARAPLGGAAIFSLTARD